MRLAGSRLPVGEYGAVVPIQRLVNQRRDAVTEEVLLPVNRDNDDDTTTTTTRQAVNGRAAP